MICNYSFLLNYFLFLSTTVIFALKTYSRYQQISTTTIAAAGFFGWTDDTIVLWPSDSFLRNSNSPDKKKTLKLQCNFETRNMFKTGRCWTTILGSNYYFMACKAEWCHTRSVGISLSLRFWYQLFELNFDRHDAWPTRGDKFALRTLTHFVLSTLGFCSLSSFWRFFFEKPKYFESIILFASNVTAITQQGSYDIQEPNDVQIMKFSGIWATKGKYSLPQSGNFTFDIA